MLLILDAARPDRDIAQDVLYVSPVVRIQHLIGSCEARDLDRVNLHLAHGNEARLKICPSLRIRLGSDSFIPFAGCPWFVCINSGNQKQLLRDPFVNFRKAGDIFTDCALIVCGTRPDNQQESGVFSRKDVLDLLIPLLLEFCESGRKRVCFTDFRRRRQRLYKGE